jgi:hypothetical protein
MCDLAEKSTRMHVIIGVMAAAVAKEVSLRHPVQSMAALAHTSCCQT